MAGTANATSRVLDSLDSPRRLQTTALQSLLVTSMEFEIHAPHLSAGYALCACIVYFVVCLYIFTHTHLHIPLRPRLCPTPVCPPQPHPCKQYTSYAQRLLPKPPALRRVRLSPNVLMVAWNTTTIRRLHVHSVVSISRVRCCERRPGVSVQSIHSQHDPLTHTHRCSRM